MSLLETVLVILAFALGWIFGFGQVFNQCKYTGKAHVDLLNRAYIECKIVEVK